MGLESRRRYRWTRGRISDYWDEVFTSDGLEGHAALDDQSAFMASLGSSRSARMLRGEDFQDVLVDEAALPSTDPEMLAGPFAHIVVDEAQELTDAEWQMLLLRCPSRSFTIVGDRAQARHGFTESWQERLRRIGLNQISLASLSINYRTPEEIMAEAEPVIRVVLPDANVPTSIRSGGEPP
jgi:DNA helicase IV